MMTMVPIYTNNKISDSRSSLKCSMPGFVSDSGTAGMSSHEERAHHLIQTLRARAKSRKRHLCEFPYWVSLLVTDNVEKLEDLFLDLEDDERDFLMNGKFEIDDDDAFENLPNMRNKMKLGAREKDEVSKLFPSGLSRSLLIATFARSRKVIEWLLDNGADVFVLDNGGNNVCHVCVLAAAVWSEREGEYRNIFKLLCRQPLQSLRRLLLTENTMCLRPLELAAKATVLGMFSDIFDVEGVYKFTKEHNGLRSTVLYDVTEYFGSGENKRVNKSPVEMLRRLTYNHLDSQTVANVLSSPPLNTWMRITISRMKVLLVLWGIVRVFNCVFFNFMVWEYFSAIFFRHSQITSVASGNHSEGCFKGATYLEDTIGSTGTLALLATMLSVRMVSTFASAAFDAIVTHRNGTFHKVVCNDTKPGPRVGDDLFYDVIDFIFLLSAVTCVLTVQMDHGTLDNGMVAVSYITLAIAVVTNVWSLMYFVRLFPVLGNFVIIFQEMFRNMLNFLFLFLLIYLSFTLCFYVIIGSQCLSEDFETLGDSLYSTFIIMLNMVNIKGSLEIESPEGIVTVILHAFYVFVVSILLLNFLIAVMSNTVSQIARHEEFVCVLNRLTTGLTLERLKFGKIFCLDKNLGKTKGLVEERGRLYIKCTYLIDSIES